MSETPKLKALMDTIIKFISDEFTEEEFNDLINNDVFIVDDEFIAEVRERMARRNAEQVETVTYPATTEPEAVPAAADRNQENGKNE